MTDNERKILVDLLGGIVKKIDPKLSFFEQLQYISTKVNGMLKILDMDIDKNDPEIIKLIKQSVVVIEDKPIVFAKGYTPWLFKAKPNISWHFYNRYEKYLFTKKHWNWGTIQSINESSDTIIDHLQNPKTEFFFGIKGLVMGDIQSGKTANYTALINKALDAGYKLIIVLAGLTKDLRSQTQKRLDKEILGHETRPDFKKGNPIGVGIDSNEVLYVNAITHSGEKGDINKKAAEAITTVLNNGMQPLIAVLKKNSSVLSTLINNFLSGEAGAKTKDKYDIPVLFVDDEVDQASVNTKNAESINEASTINMLIRKMISRFNRYAYVGYTATPFANVFINPYGFEGEEKDIFPEDFIICLPRPQDYCGVREYFGIETINDDNSEDDALTLDLYKPITDYYDLFEEEIKKTKKIKVDTPVIKINDSLEAAFKHFIIASAIKSSRGIIEHNSMLIHIARFKNPATSLKELVKNKISNMMLAYKYGDDTERKKYKDYWEENIMPISQTRLLFDFCDNWQNISAHILTIFEMTLNGIKVVNGDSADICDYESSDIGQHIIIGGDKLSRGLTLEGLIVSYYYRKSKAYDTLLQMGRWFGYRNGWIDLCRIFTVRDFVNDFINAGIAAEMFKGDVQEMNSLRLTPAEFGLKVKYSPRLAPTSSSKMKSAKKQKISFSESLQQLLSYKKDYVNDNRAVTEELVRKLGNGSKRKNGNVVFNNVSSSVVLYYLSHYKECDELVGSISIRNWINYICQLNSFNELIDWTIVLHSNSIRNESYADNIGEYKIYKNQNTDRNLYADDDMTEMFLKAVTSPTDFRDFYTPNSSEYEMINCFSVGNDIICNSFTKEHGLMALYSVDIHKKVFDKEISLPNGKKRKIYKCGNVLRGGKGVIGVGIWFPKTENLEFSAVDYYVNPVYLKSTDYDEGDELNES